VTLPLTRCTRFIPPSWRPSPYKTSGDVELWRTCLRALGIKLAVVSVCSFACKAVLVALDFFGILSGGSSVFLSLSTLLVEAVPSLLTIILLIRYHSGSIVAASGRGSDIGASLLHRAGACDHRSVNDAASRELRDPENVAGTSEQANCEQDSAIWLAHFMANGRTIGAAASNGNVAECAFKYDALNGGCR
jgi:hypothetical protein